MCKLWACIKILIDPISITCWINLWQKYKPVLRFLIDPIWELENSPNLWQNYEPVSRFLIDPIAVTIWINLGATNFTKFMSKIWACIRIFNTFWINLGARKVTKFMAKIWACIKILIDPIAITCWNNLGATKFTKFMAKIWACIKILVDPIAITSWINLGARKSPNLWQKYEPVSRF